MTALRLWLDRSQRRFLADAMQRVSRSFARMTPCLEAPLDDVVATAYLVCRLADCVEDCDAALAWKRERFAELRAVLAAPGAAPATMTAWADAPWPGLTAEEAALARLGGDSPLWSIYAVFPAAARAAFELRIGEMIEGMTRTLDPDASPRWISRGAIRALATAADYDRYCYYVAGTVGELLTDLAALHYDLPASVVATLRTHAAAAGRGLQKTNILKDFLADLRRGVCYLPGTWTELVEGAPLELRGVPPAFAAAILTDALADLDALAAFLDAVPPSATGFRLGLLVCLLPAQATARQAALTLHSMFTPAHDLKLPRQTFQRCLLDARALAGDVPAAARVVRERRSEIAGELMRRGGSGEFVLET